MQQQRQQQQQHCGDDAHSSTNNHSGGASGVYNDTPTPTTSIDECADDSTALQRSSTLDSTTTNTTTNTLESTTTSVHSTFTLSGNTLPRLHTSRRCMLRKQASWRTTATKTTRSASSSQSTSSTENQNDSLGTSSRGTYGPPHARGSLHGGRPLKMAVIDVLEHAYHLHLNVPGKGGAGWVGPSPAVSSSAFSKVPLPSNAVKGPSRGNKALHTGNKASHTAYRSKKNGGGGGSGGGGGGGGCHHSRHIAQRRTAATSKFALGRTTPAASNARVLCSTQHASSQHASTQHASSQHASSQHASSQHAARLAPQVGYSNTKELLLRLLQTQWIVGGDGAGGGLVKGVPSLRGKQHGG